MVERGTAHGLERSMINLCVYGVPPGHVYKGVEEGEGRPSMARPGGVLPPPEVGPPFPSWTRREGRGREGGRKGGLRHPFLVQFGPEGEGARGLPWPPLSLSPLWHNKAHTFTGVFR